MCEPKTWSEKLFESWCREKGVDFRCIPREEGRCTPDYELVVNGTTIIAEVKHIEDNPEEKANRKRIREEYRKERSDEHGTYRFGLGEVERGVPGTRVQKKINDCQLSAWIRTEGYAGPAILVLYELQALQTPGSNDGNGRNVRNTDKGDRGRRG